MYICTYTYVNKFIQKIKNKSNNQGKELRYPVNKTDELCQILHKMAGKNRDEGKVLRYPLSKMNHERVFVTQG